ncbi:hypothetical protein [Aquimarina sp. RZ0]|uniref:hypothetical protein n=1 Tax=Aquimarina sp. RZ0 TaxID=2607730 RepID=UPI0011F14DCF|nr:hypothetical protein [Aquimarina sp. RZ0]KAA1245039.1 hypothetical protein F0000_13595 [Aquimarina sp. RZ0]
MTKHFFFLITFLMVSITTVQSQDISEHTIGLRLTESDGFWAEASYQAALGSNNRIELNAGLRGVNGFSAIKLIGMYQWVFNINEGLNWYVGPGIGGGLADFDSDFDGDDDLEVFGFVTGDIGLEYNFDFPLLISFDFRPEFFFDKILDDDIIFNFGISARYQFN